MGGSCEPRGKIRGSVIETNLRGAGAGVPMTGPSAA